MNERIKQLAEQATNYAKDICNHDPDAVWYEVRDAKFFELVRQDEREKCAKLCEESYSRQIIHYPKGYYVDPNRLGEYSKEIASRCAAAIRGRTE
jgi:hypothetical protein